MKIWVTGASGSLGQELLSEIRGRHPSADLLAPSRSELNLEDSPKVLAFVQKNLPSHVFHLAGTVYGIGGNLSYPEKALIENTLIDHSVFAAMFKHPPIWFYYASTVASYGHPFLTLPLNESDWLQGYPHGSEFGYAMAKRHAKSYLDLLHKDFNVNFAYGLTTNLFGAGDRFLNGKGHVVVSLLQKAKVAAKVGTTLEVWGTSNTSRDFLSTSEAAGIMVDLMHSHVDVVNIASGEEIFISEIVEEIVRCFGLDTGYRFTGENEGIVRRVCSTTKLKDFSERASTVDSRKLLNNAVLDFYKSNSL